MNDDACVVSLQFSECKYERSPRYVPVFSAYGKMQLHFSRRRRVRTSVRNRLLGQGFEYNRKGKKKKRDAMCDILRRRESIEARNSDARCNDNDYDDSDDDNELLSIGINSSVKG